MYRKITLLSLSLGLCFFSFGQSKYGLKLGITQSKIEESSTIENDMDYKTGFQIGSMVEFNLIKNLSVRPALQISQKGFKSVAGKDEGPFYWKRDWSTTYLEIPIDVIYNLPLSKTSKFFVGTGPVLSIGLFGKGEGVIKGTDDAGQLHTQESSGNKPFKKPGYKRIDLGADFLTGVEFKNFILAANYNHGLMNILNYDQGIQTAKNRSFAFSIGYLISKH